MKTSNIYVLGWIPAHSACWIMRHFTRASSFKVYACVRVKCQKCHVQNSCFRKLCRLLVASNNAHIWTQISVKPKPCFGQNGKPGLSYVKIDSEPDSLMTFCPTRPYLRDFGQKLMDFYYRALSRNLHGGDKSQSWRGNSNGNNEYRYLVSSYQ